jgi:nitrogenase molybdenum-iron protein alpha/beta subunit
VSSHHDKEIGWKPEWDYERLLRDIGEEVDAVLEAGTDVRDLAGLLSK